MTCNHQPTHCAPCGDCPTPPDPILPRCDIVLPDGVYENATVVIDQGCIVSVQQGTPFAYQPNACCAGAGGGGGGPGSQGPQGDPGPPGLAATITVNSTTTVPYGQPASVQNVGTASAASLVFNIPEGAPGTGGGGGSSGLTMNSGNWNIVDGAIQSVPPSWPPAVMTDFNTDYPTVYMTGSIDSSGTLEINLNGLAQMVTLLEATMDSKDNAVLNNLQNQINALTQRLDNCSCP